MNPDEYCRQKAVPGGSSLYYALLFLTPERRRALTALHAYCRELEGVIEECSDAQVARTKLVWWRMEVARLFEGGASHPVMKALQPAIAQFEIKAEELAEIIEGKELDLSQTRYLDFAGLAHYCKHVDGATQRAAARILGYRNPRTLEYATILGTALQLARIICDTGEDARRNLIYLPMDELKRFDVPAADILQARHSDNFVKLMQFQADRAHDFFRKAADTLPADDRSAQRAGLIMSAISRATLAEVEQDGFRVLSHRTTLTPLRKLWLAWKTWVVA